MNPCSKDYNGKDSRGSPKTDCEALACFDKVLETVEFFAGRKPTTFELAQFVL